MKCRPIFTRITIERWHKWINAIKTFNNAVTEIMIHEGPQYCKCTTKCQFHRSSVELTRKLHVTFHLTPG